MNCEDNFAKGKESKEHNIDLLQKEAKSQNENAEKIQVYAERISQSCCLPYTIGSTHKDTLTAKTNDLKKLAVLYRSYAKKLQNAANKLANGKPEEKIFIDVQTYNIFFSDQLKCIKRDLQNIFSELLKDV